MRDLNVTDCDKVSGGLRSVNPARYDLSRAFVVGYYVVFFSCSQNREHIIQPWRTWRTRSATLIWLRIENNPQSARRTADEMSALDCAGQQTQSLERPADQ